MNVLENLMDVFQEPFYQVQFSLSENIFLEFFKSPEDGVSINHLCFKKNPEEKYLPLSFGPYRSFKHIEKTIKLVKELDLRVDLTMPDGVLDDEKSLEISKKIINNTKSCLLFILSTGFECRTKTLENLHEMLTENNKKEYQTSLDELMNENKSFYINYLKTKKLKYLPVVYSSQLFGEGYLKNLSYMRISFPKSFKTKFLKQTETSFFVWNLLEKTLMEYYSDLKSDANYTYQVKNYDLNSKINELTEFYKKITNQIICHNVFLKKEIGSAKRSYFEQYGEMINFPDFNKNLDYVCERITDSNFAMPFEFSNIDASSFLED